MKSKKIETPIKKITSIVIIEKDLSDTIRLSISKVIFLIKFEVFDLK
tara:strand:- start:383 stop:523 length:141 start_codon:yes stop_codon:yes gene_type:complete